MIKDFYIKIKSNPKPILISVFILIGLVSFIIELLPNPQKSEEAASSVDTFIPAGYVLIPIELQNAEAVSGMIENYAIVDLYTVNSENSTKGRLVGRKLRLIRAPLNPNRFGVLAPENESSEIANETGVFIAHIQSKNLKDSSEFVAKEKKISRIQYHK